MTALINNIISTPPLALVNNGLQILFGSLYNQPSYGGISFDVVTDEDHQYVSLVSQFPIQSGSTVIDNVIKTPTKVRMKALVSDTPYRLFEAQLEAVGRGISFVANGNAGLRSITALEALIRLQESRQPLTLVTGIQVYDNMILTKLNVPRDKRTGQMLVFDMEFQQTMLATVQLAVQGFDTAKIRSSTETPATAGDPVTSLQDKFSRIVAQGTAKLRDINQLKNEVIGSTFRFINGLARFL